MRQYLPVLKQLNRLGERAKRQFVKNCDKELIECFSECAKNILKNNVPLNSRQFGKLKSKKKDLRALAIKRTSLRKKQKIVQSGGFLSALLPPILGVLGNLLLSHATR